MSFLQWIEPQSFDEYFGNKRTVAMIRKYATEETIVIVADTGNGKTSLAKLALIENGFKPKTIEPYEVVEMGYKQLGLMLGTKPFKPIGYIIEEIDNLDLQKLYNAIRKTRIPIILTCNRIKSLNKTIRITDGRARKKKFNNVFNCHRLYMPYRGEMEVGIKKLLGNRGHKVKDVIIGQDIRNSIIATFCSSSKYSISTVYTRIPAILYKHDLSGFEHYDYRYLAEVFPKVYNRYELLKAYEILSLSVSCNDPQILKCLPLVAIDVEIPISYPTIYLKEREYNQSKHL